MLFSRMLFSGILFFGSFSASLGDEPKDPDVTVQSADAGIVQPPRPFPSPRCSAAFSFSLSSETGENYVADVEYTRFVPETEEHSEEFSFKLYQMFTSHRSPTPLSRVSFVYRDVDMWDVRQSKGTDGSVTFTPVRYKDDAFHYLFSGFASDGPWLVLDRAGTTQKLIFRAAAKDITVEDAFIRCIHAEGRKSHIQ